MNEGLSALELMLFGTLEARIDGAALPRSLTAKSRLLLAFLVLHSGRPVATSVIAEVVFPDSQAQDPHEVIKKTVQEMRRALGRQAYRLSAPGPRMLALDLEGATVDWLVFHAACKEGTPDSLQHAVAIHSRPFLEAETAPWAIAERTRCLRLRQAALETLFRQAMDGADLAAAADILAGQLTFEFPFLVVKEELWRELMQLCLQRQEYGLLHHCYTRLKNFLENTAARACEPKTQALHQQVPKAVLLQILQRKDRKRCALPASARLPVFPFALLGREAERRQLKEALDASRLVTVVGLGGMGKTRLAVQTAQEIAAGAGEESGFLDLTPCSPGNLLQTIVAALEIKTAADAPLYPALRDFLSAKPLLLVMDNCEHLVEAVAALCADLLKDCPRIKLLATSREALRVEGEQAFLLNPLAFPAAPPFVLESCRNTAAVRLFVERAVSARPDFQLVPQNVAIVVELCRLVDGLPLGIEMIASQVSAVPLDRIAEDLNDCILRLQHRRRGILPRHQSLSAALDWSYHRLGPLEQALLRRCSVFSGGWTLEAAEQVCTDETLPRAAVSGVLSDLASKSLVIPVWANSETLRFHFLDTVRVYANDQLRQAGEREHFQERKLEFFASLAEVVEQQMSGKNQQEWLERADAEYANFRAGLQTAVDRDVSAGLRLAYGLSRYWEIRGYFAEGRDWCASLLAKTAACDRTTARARVIDIAGWFDNIFGDYVQARARLQESLAIFQEREENTGASVTLIRLGLVAINLGDNEGARRMFEESLAIRRKLGDPRLIAISLLNLGIAVSNQSNYSLARSHYEECLSLLKQVGDRRIMANCLSSLGYLAAAQSEFAQAFALFEESVAVHREMGDKYLLRFDLYHLGAAAFCLEDWRTARASYAECLQLSWEAKVPFHITQTLEGLANVAAKQGCWERCVRLWGAAEGMRGLQSALAAEDQQLHDQLVSIARAELGEEAYARTLKIGLSLAPEEAVNLALG